MTGLIGLITAIKTKDKKIALPQYCTFAFLKIFRKKICSFFRSLLPTTISGPK